MLQLGTTIQKIQNNQEFYLTVILELMENSGRE